MSKQLISKQVITVKVKLSVQTGLEFSTRVMFDFSRVLDVPTYLNLRTSR